MHKRVGKTKGDTLIEVTLAIGIFSMVAVAIVSVMNSSTSGAQTALESTLTREEIDAQAEALRFIQSSYIAKKDDTDGKFAQLWKLITAADPTNSSNVTKNPYYHKTYMNILNRTLTVKRGESTDINATITSYTRNITEDINARIILNATWGAEVYTQDVVFHNGVLNTKLSIPADFELFIFYGQEITKYTLTIRSEQSKNFQETSQTATISIGEATKIYQKSLWGYKSANITFNTTLQDKSGKKINTNTTAKIDIYTNSGNLVTTFNKQITNGQLNYIYKLPSNMTDSKYIVNITAKSNKEYATSYKTVNMTLNNRKTYISTTNTKAYIGNTVIFNGTITDSITRSKSATNATIDILLDGQKLTTITTNKGTFKYSFKNNLTAGVHTVTYTFKGDNLYSNCTRTLNFTSNKNTL